MKNNFTIVESQSKSINYTQLYSQKILKKIETKQTFYKSFCFSSLGFNDEIVDQLEILDKKDVRIILGNFNETWAR